MPFTRRRRQAYDSFSWEEKADRGEEFIETISSNLGFVHWTRVLRAVSKGGVLVIRCHGRPIAVVGSPQILRDVLLHWRGVIDTQQHAGIENELALLAASAAPARSLPLRPRLIGVRARPRLAVFVRALTEQGGLAFVMRYRHAYACLIPLELLARFRDESRQRTPWTDEVLNWICSL